MDSRIGRNFKKAFRDLRTAESIRILKGYAGIYGQPNRSKFWKGIQGSMDSRIGRNFERVCRDLRTSESVQILKRHSGICGQPNRSKFWKGMQGSMDSRIGSIFGRWWNPRTAISVWNFKGGCRDLRTAEWVQILKGDAGIHETVRFLKGRCFNLRTAKTVWIFKGSTDSCIWLLRGPQRSTDDRIGTIFKRERERGWNPLTAISVFSKGDAGIYGSGISE